MYWANLSAVLFHNDLRKKAMGYWRDTGARLSTRHASFCLEEFDCLDSDSVNQASRTPVPKKRNLTGSCQSMRLGCRMRELQSFIAQLATSEQPKQRTVAPGDVLLYPNGINAIKSLSESLVSLESDSQVVAYGWLYPETAEVLRQGEWKTILSFKDETEKDLNQLGSMLQSGQRIHTLFCELPSNIKLWFCAAFALWMMNMASLSPATTLLLATSMSTHSHMWMS